MPILRRLDPTLGGHLQSGYSLSSRRTALLLNVFIVVMTLAEWATGPEVRTVFFATIAPLIAAVRCSYRCTGIVSGVFAAASTFAYVTSANPGWGVPGKLMAILGSLLISVFAVALCGIRLRLEERYTRTKEVADAVQRAMLQELPLRAGPIDVSGFYVSALEGARVGGDIYEAVRTPHGVRVLIGDVQGKGLPAIGAGHEVLASFREAAYHETALEEVAERMEQTLVRFNARSVERGGEERFVTALLVEVTGPGQVRCLSCGHVPFYLVSGDEVVERAEGEGLPLGLGELTGAPRRSYDAQVGPGDWGVLCTDGVTEARGPDGAFYPLRERLAGWTRLPPAEVVQELRADLRRFTGGALKDDATLLIVHPSADYEAYDDGMAQARPAHGTAA